MIKTTVKIDDMMCGMCEKHVGEAIQKNFAVKSVKVDHDKGIAEVVSESALDAEKMKTVIADTGYDFISVNSEPYKEGLFKGLFRR